MLKHHRNYRCCGYDSFSTDKSNTPIEIIFKNELINRKIDFEEQVVFPVRGRKFSKPDFVIRDYNILIYYWSFFLLIKMLPLSFISSEFDRSLSFYFWDSLFLFSLIFLIDQNIFFSTTAISNSDQSIFF